MAEELLFELVAPERLLVSTKALEVVMFGTEGMFGVMPGHELRVSSLRAGMLQLRPVNQEISHYFVEAGIAHMDGQCLTVLAENVRSLEEMDPEEMARQISQAEQRVTDSSDDNARFKAEQLLSQLREAHETLGLDRG